MTITYIHTCAAGESFDSVALYFFDDEKYAADIMCANPELSDRVYFAGGEKLKIPEVELPVEDDSENYAPITAPWKVE